MPRLLALLSLTLILAACSPLATPGAAARPSLPTPTPGGATLASVDSPTPAATQPGDAPAPTQPAAAPTQAPAAPPLAGSPSAFPDPAAYTWVDDANGLDLPLDLHGDGQGRLLVVEQRGLIRVIENGQVRAQPYLDLTDRVGSAGNEQGLLGLALSPQYAQNGYLYVNYTGLDGNTVIARFTADPRSAMAQASSQKVILRVTQPYPNHNGGSMVFGPDGFLYIGLGDGGSEDDPHGYGQSLDTLLGKILRIDVNQGDPYAIPPGNPFAKGQGKPEIWAYGLRNPWRFSFDRVTGDLYIADVGQNTWEEVDFLPAGSPGGANFGWNYREGAHPFQGQPPAGLTLIDPVFEYQHPEGCAITGGFVYRGTALPAWNGIYLYSDYCTGKIYGLLRGADGKWQSKLLFQTGTYLSSFGLDDAGELYAAAHQAGIILKLVKK